MSASPARRSALLVPLAEVEPAVGDLRHHYDPVAQLYWKLEVPAAAFGTSVHAYFSPDGSQWTDAGVSCMWTSVATIKVDIGVGATADPSSQPALFDDFNIKTCQP